MSEAERSAIQERLADDASYFDHVRAVEIDLVDCYARGELSPEDRQRFEERLPRSSDDLDALAFARALPHALARTQRARHERWPFRGAVTFLFAAALLLAVLSGWLAYRNRLLSDRVVALEKQQAPQPQSPPGVFAAFLEPGALRGSTAIRRIRVPADARLLDLQLDLEGDRHAVYSATLQTASGTPVWRDTDLKAKAGVVDLWLPSSALQPGTYELQLSSGPDRVDYYYFAVAQ